MATFNTKYVRTGSTTLSIEARIFDEETAISMLGRLKNDCRLIESELQVESTDIDVYIVERTLSDGIFVSGNKIYCTIEDILSERYQPDLVSLYFPGITKRWQNVGISGCIWGDPDEDALSNYYGEEKNIKTLSLFPVYFCDAFTDADALNVAISTAASMTEYIVNEYGFDSFLDNGDCSEFRQEWLRHIGVDSGYSAPFNYNYIDCALFSSSRRFPLIITIDNLHFYFEPSGGVHETPEDIMWLVLNTHPGMLAIMHYIEENSPVAYSRISDNWYNNDIHIVCGKEGTYTQLGRNSVFINTDSNQFKIDVWHEILHILIPEQSERYIWMSEGIIMNIALIAEREVKDVELFRDFYELLRGFDPLDYPDFPGASLFIALIQQHYYSVSGKPEHYEEFNITLFYEAVGLVTFLHPEVSSDFFPMSRLSVSEFRYGGSPRQNEENGNHLSYIESYVFVKYLFDVYGIDTVICSFMDNLMFEDAFGVIIESALFEFSKRISYN